MDLTETSCIYDKNNASEIHFHPFKLDICLDSNIDIQLPKSKLFEIMKLLSDISNVSKENIDNSPSYKKQTMLPAVTPIHNLALNLASKAMHVNIFIQQQINIEINDNLNTDAPEHLSLFIELPKVNLDMGIVFGINILTCIKLVQNEYTMLLGTVLDRKDDNDGDQFE